MSINTKPGAITSSSDSAASPATMDETMDKFRQVDDVHGLSTMMSNVSISRSKFGPIRPRKVSCHARIAHKNAQYKHVPSTSHSSLASVPNPSILKLLRSCDGESIQSRSTLPQNLPPQRVVGTKLLQLIQREAYIELNDLLLQEASSLNNVIRHNVLRGAFMRKNNLVWDVVLHHITPSKKFKDEVLKDCEKLNPEQGLVRCKELVDRMDQNATAKTIPNDTDPNSITSLSSMLNGACTPCNHDDTSLENEHHLHSSPLQEYSTRFDEELSQHSTEILNWRTNTAQNHVVGTKLLQLIQRETYIELNDLLLQKASSLSNIIRHNVLREAFMSKNNLVWDVVLQYIRPSKKFKDEVLKDCEQLNPEQGLARCKKLVGRMDQNATAKTIPNDTDPNSITSLSSMLNGVCIQCNHDDKS